MNAIGLDRFVEAQAHSYADALAELRDGRKESHWMWFIFPQIAGLGMSPTSRFYAIASLEEARAYLAHPALGARLRECTEAVLAHAGTRPEAIFGGIDAMKLRSSMTLFDRVADGDNPFARCLAAFFDGEPDARTLALLGRVG
jgi:uncharacterized protein (DUF1810 family)